MVYLRQFFLQRIYSQVQGGRCGVYFALLDLVKGFCRPIYSTSIISFRRLYLTPLLHLPFSNKQFSYRETGFTYFLY